MSTRIFRRPYASGSWQVSLQVSFRNKATAQQFARRIDRLKALAALEGITLSDILLHAVLNAEVKR